MRIVVDTNIVFSAVLNTDSKIARIILQPRTKLNFYSTDQLFAEINEHKKKIQELTGYSDAELDRIITLITDRIRFINVRLIARSIYEESEILTHDVDIDDCEFVALTDHIKGKLWSGDKELRHGLAQKKWDKFVTTEELFEILKKSR